MSYRYIHQNSLLNIFANHHIFAANYDMITAAVFNLIGGILLAVGVLFIPLNQQQSKGDKASTDSIYVYGGVTGLLEIKSKNIISINPNPFTYKTTIKFPNPNHSNLLSI